MLKKRAIKVYFNCFIKSAQFFVNNLYRQKAL